MLSHLSVGEFTFDDPRHAFLAGQYVDTLLPHVFFSMFDAFKVKDRAKKKDKTEYSLAELGSLLSRAGTRGTSQMLDT